MEKAKIKKTDLYQLIKEEIKKYLKEAKIEDYDSVAFENINGSIEVELQFTDQPNGDDKLIFTLKPNKGDKSIIINIENDPKTYKKGEPLTPLDEDLMKEIQKDLEKLADEFDKKVKSFFSSKKYILKFD